MGVEDSGDVVYPRLSAAQIEQRLGDEAELIANAGVEGLQYDYISIIPPPKEFTFNLADCDPWVVRLYLNSIMGGSHPPRELPVDIPPEHLDELTAILEERARYAYERTVAAYPEYSKCCKERIAKADRYRQVVPAAIERLRPAYPPDLDGAHRPIRLESLRIDAVACLDCDWLQDGGYSVVGTSAIAAHRGLHWDPPSAGLCDMLHEGYETLTPERFPDPWEVFEPLLYGPIATKTRTFGERKRSRECYFCDPCYERLGPENFDPYDVHQAPWTLDREAGGYRWNEDLRGRDLRR